MAHSYDVKCYDLAKSFLADSHETDESTIDELAQRIQTTIEDFITYEVERQD